MIGKFSSRGNSTEPVTALSPVAWYRYANGLGTSTTTSTQVSSWQDKSGNSRHFVQTSDANRPALQADSSILFDGISSFFATTFVFTQPETVYFLGKQVSFTTNDRLFDGPGGSDLGSVRQSGASPNVVARSGSDLTALTSYPLDTYGVLSVVFNGTTSLIQLNNQAPITGNAGTNNLNGLTLGSIGTSTANFANIQVKEVIAFAAAHDTTTRAAVITYLASVGGLNI